MNKVINVQSEIGTLKSVILKRPCEEIENLMPEYLPELLFEDIPYLLKIQEEHDYFANVLTERGIEVLYVDDLITQALETDSLKEEFLNAILNESAFLYGYTLNKIKDYLLSFPTPEMVAKIMAGVRKDELNISKQKSLLALALDYPFYVPPMPNLFFTRDPAAAIGHGISISKMKESIRKKESLFMNFILANHSRFKNADIPIWVDFNYRFTIEGGDILVLGKETVAIGISARTSIAAIEHLAKNLFANQSEIKKVLAVDIPKRRAFMHLDTVFTMLDHNKFTIHPDILDKSGEIDSYILEPGDGDSRLKISARRNIEETLKEVLSLDEIEFIPCGGGDAIAASREQWTDGSNTLAIAPGVVVTYDRNYVTNKILRERGVEVIEILSSELSRGRGGPRCMSMPLYREDL